jgi:hypothetical protein
MGATWNVIQPLAATNYVVNPSFEKWSAGPIPTGWATLSSPTIYTATDLTWRGAYACKLSSATLKYIYQDIALVNTQSYTISVYCFNNGATGSALFAYDYGGASNIVSANNTASGWQRLVLTKVAANGGIRVCLGTAVNDAWFDALQVEDGLVASTYIDGYEPGCYWNGVAHLSTSSRDGQTREGGLPVPLTTYLNKVQEQPGTGTPPFKNVSLPMGLVGGEIYQRTIKQARVFSLTGWIIGTSTSNFHNKKRALFDLLKYDAVTPNQPVKLQYDIDGINKLEIKAVYDSGLEMGADVQGLKEFVNIRMIAHDPLFYAEQNMAQLLGYSQTVTNANYILMQGKEGDPTQAGMWLSMGTGVSAGVGPNAIVYNPIDGCTYVGGGFTGMNSVANTAYIAKWTPGTPGVWSALGTGMNGVVNALAVGADGSVYVGGLFTTGNGVTLNHIGKWNGSTFVAMGGTPGTNGTGVNAMSFGPDGSLYVGGDFTTAGGTTVNYVAKWNGSAWSAMGTTGVNGDVYALATGPGGYIYVGGTFAAAAGVTVNNIAAWNVATSVWTAMSTGTNGIVYALCVGADGCIWAGGTFTTAGGIAVNNIAKWTGVGWYSPSTGVTGGGAGLSVRTLATNPKTGMIYIGGYFTTAGGIAMTDSITIWTGTSFLPMDVKLPAAPAIIFAIAFNKFGNLILGYNHSDDGSGISATVTASSNSSTRTYPKIWMYGPGTIYQIINYTTGRAIYFNNLVLQTGEQVSLELKPGKIQLASNWRGNLSNYILQGSSLDFYLQPGANNISCYVVGGSINPLLTWKNSYWSSDGVA